MNRDARGGPPTADGRAGAKPDVRILLVDDDETWVTSTGEVLERQRSGFVVETATDLDAATRAFEDRRPDCVVCDYDLAGETGLALLETVRDSDPDLPFVLVTGQGDESVASDAIAREVTDYIPKRRLSGRDDLLARRISAAVDAYRTERALERERRSKDAMLDILTASSTPTQLAREFCQHLVDGRDYECAWIGTPGQSRGLLPEAVAGGDGYVDDATDDGDEPALVAMRGRQRVVRAPIDAQDAESDSESEGEKTDWRSTAVDRGFESAVAVPLTHEGTTIGVLAVYGTDPAVDEDELELLAEYADAIAYALRSAEWKESTLSESSVTVELELEDERAPLVALDDRLPDGSRIEQLTTVAGNETVRYVLRVEGAHRSDLEAATAPIDGIETVGIDPRRSTLRWELLVELPTPESVASDYGTRVAEATAADGRAVLTAVSADENAARAFVDGIQSTYPESGVRSIRSGDVSGAQIGTEDVVEALTDRQRTTVEMAFYNGYFERPRKHNATEIAEKVGVTRQTLTQHLRAGQRKILGQLLDPPDENRRD